LAESHRCRRQEHG
jgi:hypothetical protein